MVPEIDRSLEIINSIPGIDSILSIVSKTTGMGFSAVAIVTETKWVAAAVKDDINFGLKPGGELELKTTICDEIRQHKKTVVIDHVKEDEHFANHHTPLQYGFQSYISVPIVLSDGSFFGTLCSIDPFPASLNNSYILEMFRLYAQLIAFHVDNIMELQLAEERLLEEQQTSRLKELFMAVLGHDLRNPLTAISNAAQLIGRIAKEGKLLELSKIIHGSSLRMKAMISNIVDYSRVVATGGWPAELSQQHGLKEQLGQTVEEIRLSFRDREIHYGYNSEETVYCDAQQVCQAVTNLMVNALNHGAADQPVKLEVTDCPGGICLKVTNAGKAIPKDTIGRIFQPFSNTGQNGKKPEGLGLGLYIVSEIARAHGGSVTVNSDECETCFCLQLQSAQ